MTCTVRSIVAAILAAASAGVHAQAQQPPRAPVLEEVLVSGQIVYRDRVDTASPVLQYGLDYFQRFEPPTVGDMLKRVPGVAFLSDANEYDGVRLRGLDAAYTQILINGKKVPGAEADRSFWVDRIPSELIERIEIVRSSSADVSAEGVGGALNIVLKEGGELDGGYLRAGALYYDGDSKTKPSVGGVWGGASGDWRYTLGFNAQGRHNPKSKVTDILDDDNEPDELELESDIRNGTDYSGNFSLQGPLGPLEFGLKGFYVHTDRDEHENVQTFDATGATPVLNQLETQDEDITQDNYSADLSFALPIGNGKTSLDFGYARFKNDIVSTEAEAEDLDEEPDAGLEPTGREFDNTRDRELSATLAHTFELATGKLKMGVDWQDRKRDGDVTEAEFDDGEFGDPEAAEGGVYRIKEQRIDPFVKYTAEFGALRVEGGVRYESTDVDVTGEDGTASNDYSLLAPSLHLRYALNDSSRIYGSVSRTARRPDFDWISPHEEEYEDLNLQLGNPGLKPEKAWGLDVGFEHRFGRQGIFGINLLYRDIQDVIERVTDGTAYVADDDEPEETGYVFTRQNVNDGKVWGVELDLSTPLSFSPNTGVFLNAALLDSEILDPLLGTKRRMTNQPKYIFNAGFIQNLAAVDAAFGASFRKQGVARQVELVETRSTSYEGDLELFVEKRFGDTWVARLTVSNLLDSEKLEDIHEYDGDTTDDILDNLRADSIDARQIEHETAGPVFQLVFRASF